MIKKISQLLLHDKIFKFLYIIAVIVFLLALINSIVVFRNLYKEYQEHQTEYIGAKVVPISENDIDKQGDITESSKKPKLDLVEREKPDFWTSSTVQDVLTPFARGLVISGVIVAFTAFISSRRKKSLYRVRLINSLLYGIAASILLLAIGLGIDSAIRGDKYYDVWVGIASWGDWYLVVTEVVYSSKTVSELFSFLFPLFPAILYSGIIIGFIGLIASPDINRQNFVQKIAGILLGAALITLVLSIIMAIYAVIELGDSIKSEFNLFVSFIVPTGLLNAGVLTAFAMLITRSSANLVEQHGICQRCDKSVSKEWCICPFCEQKLF
ncbi:hypothetical protein ACFLU3_05730 [Chloroflexota bacterium]